MEISQTTQSSILVRVHLLDPGNLQILKLGVLVNGDREVTIETEQEFFDVAVDELIPDEEVSIVAFAQNKAGMSKSEEFIFTLTGESQPIEGLTLQPNFVKLEPTVLDVNQISLNVGIRSVIDPNIYSYQIEYSSNTGLTNPIAGEPIYKAEPQIEQVDDNNLNLSLPIDCVLESGSFVAFRVIATNSDGDEFISAEFRYQTSPTIKISEVSQTSKTSILVKVLLANQGDFQIRRLGVLINGEREITVPVSNILVLFEIEIRDLAPGKEVSIFAFAENDIGLSKSEERLFSLVYPGLTIKPNFVKLNPTNVEPYRMTINVGIRDVIDPYSYSYLIEHSPYTELMYPKEGEPIYREEPQIERIDDFNLNLSLQLDSILYPGGSACFRAIAINDAGQEFITEEFRYDVPKSNFVIELDNVSSVVSHSVSDIKSDEEGNLYVCGVFDEGNGKDKGFIVKFNKDEEVLWRVNSTPPTNFKEYYDAFAIENGILYAQLGRQYSNQGAGFIHAFNTSNDSLIWETMTNDDGNPNTYNVIVRNGIVYSSGGRIARVSTSGEYIDALPGFTHCVYPIEGGILAGSRGADDNNYQARLEFFDNNFNSLSVIQDSMKRGDILTDPFASIIYFEEENLIITVKYVSYLPLPSYNYLEAYTLVGNQLKLLWSKNIGQGSRLRLAKYGQSIAVASISQERKRKGPALYDLSGNLIWELGIPAVDGSYTIVGNRMYLVNYGTLRRVDLPSL